MAQLWGGRFTKATDKMVYDFNASINFDKELFSQDIRGSKAHVKMLASVGVITEAERDEILKGLEGIEEDVRRQALDQGEGHVEAPQRAPQVLDAGHDGLVHADDGLHGHEVGVDGVHDVVVDEHAEHRHGHRAGQRTHDGARPGAVAAVDQARGHAEAHAQHEVAQLAHAAGAAVLDEQASKAEGRVEITPVPSLVTTKADILQRGAIVEEATQLLTD